MPARVKELEKQIRYHQDRYYAGEPEISDSEFDLLWDELKRLDPGNGLFQQVGSDSTDGYVKREHIMPMGSQDKAADPESFLKWASKVQHERYIVQFKMDGASLELQYENGLLVYGITRGDGTIGDDITANVRRMQNIKTGLPDRFTGAVRGEVLMSRATHRSRYADKANTRNAANGIMKRKDGVGAEDLVVVCYDAFESTRPDYFRTEQAKLKWLETAGLRVVEYTIFDNADDVVAYREKIAQHRGELEFDIDGLVVKGEEIDTEDMARARPEKQIAFKFELEEAASTLIEVIWSPSGSLYTPIGVLDPVRLAGTTVKRANLVNPRLIRAMDLRIGSRVAVTKRGEIIPKIERLLENPAGTDPITFPEICETCGSPLVDEDTRLYCPNEACSKRSFFRLRKWLDVLDIRDFGDVILRQLFDAGIVREVADLYKLAQSDLEQFERMGATLAAKIIRNLRAVSTVPLSKFIAGFNIEGVGVLITDKLVAAGIDTLPKLRAAATDELAAINGIGEVLAAKIVSGVAQLRREMDDLLATGQVEIAERVGGKLDGVSFCFTGTLQTMKRSEAQDRVRASGGTVLTSVTTGLDYLVTNDPESGSSKNRKARETGTSIIDEEEFLRLLSP
jgi:DNA ligase (NAD+)